MASGIQHVQVPAVGFLNLGGVIQKKIGAI